MKEINGKQFPDKWSDLALDVAKVEGLDNEPTISIKCVLDWIEEYCLLTEGADLNLVDNLHKKGCELLHYMTAVKWRIHGLYKTYEQEFKMWKSQTTTNYPGEKLSEAARERMVILEEKYQTYQNFLIRLETIEGWCDDEFKTIRDSLKQLDNKTQIMLQMQPRLPIVR